MGILNSNTVIIVIVTVLAFVIIYFIFKKDLDIGEGNDGNDVLSLPYLKDAVKSLFNEIINQNIAALYLSKKETKKREQQKSRLTKALRSCAQGNLGEKEYVKDYIMDLLQNNLRINEGTINRVIPFDRQGLLTPQDKFDILLQQYKKIYRYEAFERLAEECGFEEPKTNEYGTFYEITGKDIEDAYIKLARPIIYIDALSIVTQRIYQEVYGFSVADEIRDMKIDGISGGVSGAATEQYNYMEEVIQSDGGKKLRTYDSLWIFLHGKAVHLSFLSFGTQGELIRTCKNLYRYDNVGHLTSSNGYKLTYLHDGSRVVVVRPKLSTHWAFFVRKFDSARHMTLEYLINDKGNEKVIEMLRWGMKGCLNIVLSGDQNSGKTTCLKALIQYIDQRYPIRTTEQEFELWLNNMYQNLNVLCMRDSDEVNLVEAVNIQKKMDASIMILGEVASYELANLFITLKQAGTKMTMCTCHCVSTEDLIDYFRNAGLSDYGPFNNERVAEEQVANSIDIDVHWEKTGDGHRYIGYINEILPYNSEEEWPVDAMESIAESLKRLSRKRAYYIRPIISYENGEYIMKNEFSDKTIQKIMKNLTDDDKEAFVAFNTAG